MKTIKIRFVRKKNSNNYNIQRKTIFGWKYIGYYIDMGYGGVYNYYSNHSKDDLLLNVLENYYKQDKRFVEIIEHPEIKIY
jgi:hypothetical protein